MTWYHTRQVVDTSTPIFARRCHIREGQCNALRFGIVGGACQLVRVQRFGAGAKQRRIKHARRSHSHTRVHTRLSLPLPLPLPPDARTRSATTAHGDGSGRGARASRRPRRRAAASRARAPSGAQRLRREPSAAGAAPPLARRLPLLGHTLASLEEGFGVGISRVCISGAEAVHGPGVGEIGDDEGDAVEVFGSRCRS